MIHDFPVYPSLTECGFVFVEAARMRLALEAAGSLADWPAFIASWDDLMLDAFMADQGRYRRRRYGVFRVEADGEITRCPHEPHYQAREYNPLNGGVARWFEPITPAMGESDSLRTILGFCGRLFGALRRDAKRWHVEVHQFRIEARIGLAGLPTPEGVHRDGVDFVLVLLIRRHNIASGVTTIYAPDRRRLGSFTLTEPFDAALLEDARVFHGVTAVYPVDAALPAYRDVLVATFRRAG